MESTVEFDSRLFSPYLPDEAQVNPNVYGAELMYWLSKKLAEHDIMTSYPNFEDWGWYIEYIKDSGEEYWLCGSNQNGSSDKWRCFIEPKARGLFGRNKAPIESAQPLIDALRVILQKESEIINIKWNNEY